MFMETISEMLLAYKISVLWTKVHKQNQPTKLLDDFQGFNKIWYHTRFYIMYKIDFSNEHKNLRKHETYFSIYVIYALS